MSRTAPPSWSCLFGCLTLLLLLTPACRTGDAETTSAPPPPPPPLQPPRSEILGTGTVSTPAPEFATSVSADGSEVYFNRATDDRSKLVILVSRLRDGTWAEAEALPFSDGTYRDVDPFVTEDGQRLFFSSNRPSEGETEPGDFDVWYVERTADGGWSKPVNPGSPVNTDSTEIYSTLSRNGHLYFGSDREGESFIYRSQWIDGRYAEPERLVLGSGVKSMGSNPAIAPDESFLVFSTQRDDGLGGSDLYASFRTDDGWTAPRLISEPVSSTFADFAPTVGWGGRYLYFTSERPGVLAAGAVEARPPGDLYYVEWEAVRRGLETPP